MSVSVRVRFEVFKRDRFTCSYCGRTPPEVLLEVDHIIPKAAGGGDDLPNLTTACATCNRGKGARLLEEGHAPVVGRATVEELAERVEQAKQYMELLGGMSALLDSQIQLVFDAWAKAFRATAEERDNGTFWVLPHGMHWPNESSIRRFLRALPLADVLEAVDIAASKFGGLAPQDTACRYFYGVCRKAIERGGVNVGPVHHESSEDAAQAYRDGYRAGVEAEHDRLRTQFLTLEECGFESAAELVVALWSDD